MQIHTDFSCGRIGHRFPRIYTDCCSLPPPASCPPSAEALSHQRSAFSLRVTPSCSPPPTKRSFYLEPVEGRTYRRAAPASNLKRTARPELTPRAPLNQSNQFNQHANIPLFHHSIIPLVTPCPMLFTTDNGRLTTDQHFPPSSNRQRPQAPTPSTPSGAS
jgi:hypothetical protein